MTFHLHASSSFEIAFIPPGFFSLRACFARGETLHTSYKRDFFVRQMASDVTEGSRLTSKRTSKFGSLIITPGLFVET